MSVTPAPEAASPVLRVEAVRKSFGASPVLRDIDLEVAPHTVTALRWRYAPVCCSWTRSPPPWIRNWWARCWVSYGRWRRTA